MLKGKDIICVASADWDAMWVNAQHLMHRLSEHNRVLYINNTGLRPPGKSGADLSKILRRLKSWFARPKPINKNLTVLSPISIPLHRFGLIRRFNRFLMRRRIRRVAGDLGMINPILWTFLPTAVDLIGAFGESALIYQCVDDYSANPMAPAETIREMEKKIEARADLVIVTSPALRDAKKASARKLFYSPNVADVAHFRDSQEALPKALAQKIAGRKVIGYAGNISGYKTDVALIGKIADAFPECAVVLAGPVGWGDPGTDVRSSLEKSNVIMAGRIEYDELPAVIKSFDVCILPMNDNESTRASFPMKFYEYMACGKPIVARDLPSFNNYRSRPDLCRLAKTHKSFIKALEDALTESGDEGVETARLAEAEKHDWPKRALDIGKEVTEVMTKENPKIALVHDWLTGMRGGEKVLEAMCEIWPKADLYTLLHIPGKLSVPIERMNIHTSFIQKLPFAASKYRHYLPLFPTAIESFDLRGYDMVISTSHCVAKGVITAPHTCHISYLHTPMRYVWDLYEDYFGPQRVRSGLTRALIHLFAGYLRLWDAATANRVDAYASNSRFVAKRIAKYYRREATVINPPVDVARYRPGKRVGDYYLIVSAMAPYKRLDLAVKAASAKGFALKVVGIGEDMKALKAIAGPTVEFLGWRSGEELTELYRECRAFLFPGQEDFGITPVEAQACGRPVIAYASGGALETVRGVFPGEKITDDATGVFFREQTPESLIEAIEFYEAGSDSFSSSRLHDHALSFGTDVFKKKIKDFAAVEYKKYNAGADS